MRFLLDESADYPLASYLREWGHDVTAIVRDYPRSMRDRDVLSLANNEQRILITNDADFGELIFRQQLPHSGVIFFRLGEESIPTKARWLSYVLDNHVRRLEERYFIVVTDRGVRIRPGFREWVR